MLSNQTFVIIVRFIVLFLVQVLVFNNFGFMGYINPMIYVLFVFWFPISGNRSLLLATSFLLGFIIDIFSDSLAIHTFSLITVAYLRPLLIRFCYGANVDLQGFSIKNTTRLQRYALLALIVFMHHFCFFSLEIFSLAHLPLILKKFISTGLITLTLALLINGLFSKKP